MERLRSTSELSQLDAATELADMLLLGNEESLPNLPIKDIVHALIILLQKEHNFVLVSWGFDSLKCFIISGKQLVSRALFRTKYPSSVNYASIGRCFVVHTGWLKPSTWLESCKITRISPRNQKRYGLLISSFVIISNVSFQMLTAARCISNMLEALPRALPVVIDTVPHLLEKVSIIRIYLFPNVSVIHYEKWMDRQFSN